ncbi:MAG: MipA/OmpV family protein [Desulfobacterales bacterium]|nr:MipA/OmpV family protein [Desulfobacterales bacterium]
MKRILLGLAILILSTLMTNGVQAQGPKMVVGLGAAVAPDYEGSDDGEGVPLILFNAEWDNHMSVSIMGTSARVNLLPHPFFRAGLAMEYIKKRDDVDNDAVDALPDVDTSFMAGGFFGFDYQGWNGSIELMTDVADGNDGSIARLKGGYEMQINKAMKLNLGIFTTWADDDYMESYFSVSEAGSIVSGLDTYNADSGLKDVGLNVSVHYTPWQHWGIMGVLVYKRLLNDAEDSPVVDKEGNENQATFGIMATYRF